MKAFKKVLPYLPLLGIFLLAFILRVKSIWPANYVVGFDQARDLFDVKVMLETGHLRIIGPTAGNSPSLHHGILFLYYILPPLLLFQGNPVSVSLWNSLFNASLVFVLYSLSLLMFKDKFKALVTAGLTAVSFCLIEYSGWFSNPTVTIFTVPVFFLGLWLYYLKKDWGLVLAFFFLGLSIQFELFFIYLLPVTILLFLLLRMKWPNFKTILFSTLVLCLSLSTMIATEIKFKFSGVKVLLGISQSEGVDKGLFLENLKRFITKYYEVTSLNFTPQNLLWGKIIGIAIVVYLLFQIIRLLKKKGERDKYLFLLVYLVSPLIMLLVGYHQAPWFLVGLPPILILISGDIISHLRPKVVIVILLLLIGFLNLKAIRASHGRGQISMEPDRASIAAKQLAVIDYTYLSSDRKAFVINTVTNPLYINSVWAYQYGWYGKSKYGYLPAFAGGDQIPPYDTLGKPTGKETYLFLIIDQTPRIPDVHKQEAFKWANKQGKIIEEKDFDGILVQKRLFFGHK
jgi:hypothetical protein